MTLKKNIYPLIYTSLSHERLRESVYLGPIASHDIVITQFGHYVKLASKPSAVPRGLT